MQFGAPGSPSAVTHPLQPVRASSPVRVSSNLRSMASSEEMRVLSLMATSASHSSWLAANSDSASCSLTTSLVAAKTWMMFLKFRMFRASRYAVISRPPRAKPLVNRTSNSLKEGRRDWLSPSGNSRSQLSPDMTSWSAKVLLHRVYGVPLVYRKRANTPKFWKMLPTVVPSCQSPGKLSDAAAAKVCGRLKSVGKMACGGGWLPPDSWLMTREPKSTYVSGSDPVFLASMKL